MGTRRNLGLAGSLLATLTLAAAFRAPAADGPEWSTDLDQARARAALEKKPLLVVFR